MDGSIHTTSTQKSRVGSIHDCIHVQLGDVSKLCPENSSHRLESLPPPATLRHLIATSVGRHSPYELMNTNSVPRHRTWPAVEAGYAERMEQSRPFKTPKKTWGLSPKQSKKKARKSGASSRPGPDSILPVIQARLNLLFPDAEAQTAWMETLHPLFATSPLELIHSGREGMLLAHLEAWLRDEE